MGAIPEYLPQIHINRGNACLWVFVDSICVGAIWKYRDSKNSKANGQAEIKFFDKYKSSYNTWHRMFDNGERIWYDNLYTRVEQNGEYIYYGKIINK